METDLKYEVGRATGVAGWFMRHALLLPVIVIASYFIGRGLGDSLQLLYLLCGLYSLRFLDLRPHRTPVYLLILLLVLFLVSVFYPDFSARSFKYWVLYALSGLVLIFTVGVSSLESREADNRVMVWISVSLLIGFASELGYFFFILKDFHPATQVNGMILATLAPLIFFHTKEEQKSSASMYVLFYLLSLVLLSFADSRTELLMLLIGGAVYFSFYARKMQVFLFAVPVIIITALAVDGLMFNSQSLNSDDGLFQWLNQLSSLRLEIWAEALTHPPENYLTGVGMRRSIEFLPEVSYVKHLHNMFIEIWYETGLLGLLGYLTLIFVLLSNLPRAYQVLEGMDRRVYAVFFSSGVAALIGGILDKGYIHPITRYYMLFCFSVLYILTHSRMHRRKIV